MIIKIGIRCGQANNFHKLIKINFRILNLLDLHDMINLMKFQDSSDQILNKNVAMAKSTISLIFNIVVTSTSLNISV